MLGKGRKGNFQPDGYEFFVGLDTDKRSMAVTILDCAGRHRSFRMAHDADQLLGYMNKRYGGRKVVFCYEAGPTGYGLRDRLVEVGHPCVVTPASMVPRAPGLRVKTNRLDSVKLAECLKGGQLHSIHIPGMVYRQLRHLVSLRDTHIGQMKGFKYRIKALLLFEGLAFPEAPAGSQWSRRVIRELRQMFCSGAVGFKLNQLLKSVEFHRQQALESLRAIRKLCQEDPELGESIGYIMSIPGIGWITASHLVARIGDWRHLDHVGQLAGFFGLAGSEHSTGERVNRGPITRMGDSRLRSKLIQAAWSAIRQDWELGSFYQRIYQRHPRDRASRKAIVAVARKLTTRIYVVLKERRNYQAFDPKKGDQLAPGRDSTLRRIKPQA